MIGIDPDKTVSPIVDQKKVEDQKKTGSRAFQNFFQQAVGSAKKENPTVESSPFVSEIRPAQFQSQAESSTNIIYNQVGHLIDTMESYQQQLIESDATLKDIEPIIEKIVKQSESLLAVSEGVEMQDDLKSIVNQSLSLSAKEIAQYKNGHYNDA